MRKNNQFTYLLLLFAFLISSLPVLGRTPPVTLAPTDASIGKAGLLICLPVATETISPAPTPCRYYGNWRDHRIVTPVNPQEAYGQKVFAALLKNNTVKDSLKLRRIALNIRREEFNSGKGAAAALSGLNDETKRELQSFMSAHTNQPLVILAKAPAGNEKSGNAASRMPGIVRNKSGKDLLWVPNTLWLVGDIPMNLENDTLSIVFGHENAHIIMFDMYGSDMRNFLRQSTNGHMAPYMTDQGLAFIEGWAEAFEAVYGPANPRLSERDRTKYNIAEFRFERQDPVRRERYIWARYFGRKTGVLKNGNQMMATEGVIAGLFYDILVSRAINAPFEKCVRTMYLKRPLNFQDFIREYLKLYPEDRKVITRIVLENTRYVTISKEAAARYHTMYQTGLAYKHKRPGGENYSAARTAFNSFKEQLYARAVAGQDLFTNVGTELWFTGKVSANVADIRQGWNLPVRPADRTRTRDWQFNLDLNTVTEKMLTVIGLSDDEAAKVIRVREQHGFFKGKPLPTITSIIGKEAFEKLIKNSSLQDYNEARQAAATAGERHILWPEAFVQGE